MKGKAGNIIQFIVASLCLAGCEPGKPKQPEAIKSYKIKLVRPDGLKHKEFIIKSFGTPYVGTHIGGQTVLCDQFRQNENRAEWDGQIAPVGWLWEIEILPEQNQSMVNSK